MANPYYGYFGDVWKHLALAAILEGERPERYCDSHAGSATYPALPSRRRPWDYWHFIDHAPSSPALAKSTYLALLQSEIDRGADSARYPGSPFIAMSRLGGSGATFLFADTDPESLRTIADAATELEITSDRLTQVHGDGTVRLNDASGGWGAETLVFVDPFIPLAKTDNGMSPIDLVVQLVRRGVKTVLWYSISPVRLQQHEQVKAELRAGVGEQFESSCWFGQVHLEEAEGIEARLLGCGIMAANVSASTLQRCAALGSALAAILSPASFEMTNER
jgi:23S rRNA A2030 N6-methylase RlmJ